MRSISIYLRAEPVRPLCDENHRYAREAKFCRIIICVCWEEIFEFSTKKLFKHPNLIAYRAYYNMPRQRAIWTRDAINILRRFFFFFGVSVLYILSICWWCKLEHTHTHTHITYTLVFFNNFVVDGSINRPDRSIGCRSVIFFSFPFRKFATGILLFIKQQTPSFSRWFRLGSWEFAHFR